MGEDNGKEILSLSQIAEREPCLTIDSSVTSNHMFTKDLYTCHQFRSIDCHDLEQLLAHFYERIEVHSLPHIFIVDTVVNEFSKLRRILSKSMSHLEFREKKKNEFKKREKYKSFEPAQQQIFSEVCYEALKLEKLLKSKVLKPEYPEVYQQLVEAMKCLEENLWLKQKDKINQNKDEYRHPRETSVDLRTDEKIAAAALYKAIFEKTSVAMVANDADIQRLTSGFFWAMSKQRFSAMRAKMSAALRANNIKRYCRTVESEQKYFCNKVWDHMSSSEENKPSSFAQKNLSINEMNLVKDKVFEKLSGIEAKISSYGFALAVEPAKNSLLSAVKYEPAHCNLPKAV